MIIKNKLQTDNTSNYQRRTINYQNAIFQGESNKINKMQECSGIIYIPENHHFIVCSQFANNKIAGNVLFFHKHHTYFYGTWSNNCPHGISVFLMQEVLIITSYQNGILIEGTKILMIFQKFNIGVIVEVGRIDSWKIKYKREVYCSEHIQKLIQNCSFEEEIFGSLVKYINNRLADLTPSLKFRMVNEVYYRYGFDKGLGIIFDDDSNIKSVGFHNQHYIGQAGKIYYDINRQGQHQITNAVINKSEYKKEKRSSERIGKIYSKSQQNKQNLFINQYYSDPSLSYFQYFEQLLQLPLIKRIFTGFILNNSLQISSPAKQNQSKRKTEGIQQIKNQNQEKKQSLLKENCKQKQQILNKNHIQSVQQNFEEANQIKTFNVSQKYGDNLLAFQKFPQKCRLNIISEDLNHSIIHKNNNKSRQISSQQMLLYRQNTPIDKLNQFKQKQLQKHYDQQIKSIKNKEPLIQQQSAVRSNQQRIPNSVNKEMGRLKKKIFEQSTIKKKQHSPIVSADKVVSPSKKRVKIFTPTPSNKDKFSSSIQKYPRVHEKMMQINANIPIQGNQSQISPQNKLKFTEHISMQDKCPKPPLKISDLNDKNDIRQQALPSERIQQEHISEINNNNNLSIYGNYKFRKDNQVYLNKFSNGAYSNYVNHPISIVQTENRQLVRNKQSNLPSHSLPNGKLSFLDSHKKNIVDTMPYKQNKVKSYMQNKSNMVYLQKAERYTNTANNRKCRYE